MRAVIALAGAGTFSSAFEIVFQDDAGGRRRESLSLCWSRPFEQYGPVRAFPSVKGQTNWPGYWWSVTTGRHVGYESWLERDVAMMLDFDDAVIGFSSQPFWVCWSEQNRQRRHAPDFFARLADGGGVVVDVRPDDRIDAVSAEAFAATTRACAEVGWEFRRTAGPAAVLAANVRWLAGYRHRRCLRAETAAALIREFAVPRPLLAGAGAVGDPIAVLPVLYHLLWSGLLRTDLAHALLGSGSVIVSAGAV